MNQSGIALPEATYQKLEDEVVDVYVVNKNELPFDVGDGYVVGQPIIPIQFRELFKQHYVKVQTTTYFDIWLAKRHPSRSA